MAPSSCLLQWQLQLLLAWSGAPVYERLPWLPLEPPGTSNSAQVIRILSLYSYLI